MNNYKTLITVLAFLIMALPVKGFAISTISVQFQDTLILVSLDMPRKTVIETLGTPDIIKSEGMCLQYEHLGFSIFLNKDERVEQIYLARNFEGRVGTRPNASGINLSDIEKEFGPHSSAVRHNYQPSPLIQSKATTETENRTEPTGKQIEEFPLQYPGNKKLYQFYNAGKVMKYKYVIDDEGIAFWLDQNQKLYATVLYAASRNEKTRDKVPADGKVAVATEKIRLPMIHFDFDKHNIKKIYVPVMDQHVAYLKDRPASTLTIDGHTDYFGSDEYNQKLSERRAEAARKYLVEKGIASSRIRSVGYSEHRPMTDDKSPAGRALNRRAEFEVSLEK